MSAPVLVEEDNNIAWITLNRPDRLNALTKHLLDTLTAALSGAVANPSVRVICIRGAGHGFCAGQDLTERDPRGRSASFDLEAIQKRDFHPTIRTITETDKPVLAAVHGIAAGAGASLALACDIVMAARSAKFAFSFSKVGLSVDAGGGWALTKAIGPQKARALLLLGAQLAASEAEAQGLIWKAVPDDDLEAVTRATAAELAQRPAKAMGLIKRAVDAAETSPTLQVYLETEARLQGEAGRHPDYAEGVLAFLEKRQPRF